MCVCVCVYVGWGVSVSVFVKSQMVRVQWGIGQKRERGRVELPDSLMYEAVLQSAGPRLETPQSPP